MKKEISFIVILLALLLLVPGVIAPSIVVTVKGDGSDTTGTVESVNARGSRFENEVMCDIVIVNGVAGTSGNCSTNSYGLRDNPSCGAGWKVLTLESSEQPNTALEWSVTPTNGGLGFKQPGCSDEVGGECSFKLQCPPEGLPDKNFYYTINAKFERVNNPPNVKIDTPTSGAIFIQGQSIPITATASDDDGTIKSVQFFYGGNSIGTDNDQSDGWSISWSNAPLGDHLLTAKATDDKYTATISDKVTITVKAASCGDGKIQNYEVNGVKIIEECEFNPSSTTANCPIPPESCNLPGTKDECKCSRDYCVGACTYKVDTIGNCENGQQIVTLIKGNGCTIEQCKVERTMTVPCERRVAMLPFFTIAQVISTITLTIIIYLFALSRKKK